MYQYRRNAVCERILTDHNWNARDDAEQYSDEFRKECDCENLSLMTEAYLQIAFERGLSLRYSLILHCHCRMIQWINQHCGKECNGKECNDNAQRN